MVSVIPVMPYLLLCLMDKNGECNSSNATCVFVCLWTKMVSTIPVMPLCFSLMDKNGERN